jgi:N-methylhydantoinase A
MRYYGQEHTVKVPIPAGEITSDSKNEVIRRFHDYHEREYAFRLESPVEIVNFHVTGILKVKKLTLNMVEEGVGSIDDAVLGDRKVFLNGDDIVLPVYSKVRIPRGVRFEGPAIIEDPTSTILMLASHVAEVDRFGNIVIVRGGV